MATMNALTRAVATVRRKIPLEILRYAFTPHHQQWNNTPNSLDHQILQDVIRSRVLVDCNLLGGQEDYIRLSGLPYERTSELMSVVHVPKERTNGRSITQVLHLTYHDYTSNLNTNPMMSFKPCSVTPLTVAAGALANSLDMPGMTGTSLLELIAENTVLVKDPAISPQNGVLRCILSNDEELNNISIRSFVAFCEMATLAVKSHIYNTAIVQLDEGAARFGRNIGAFRQVIEGYADAEQMYIEFLTDRWQKIAFMNDRESSTRFIRAQLGGYR